MYNNNYYNPQPYRAPAQPIQAPQYMAQSYTPPTIHAEIIQASEQEARAYNIGAGQTQMFCARDDSAFFIKTAYPNGGNDFVIYRREEPQPEQSPDYITRGEFDTFRADIEKLLTAATAGAEQEETGRKKAAKNESV